MIGLLSSLALAASTPAFSEAPCTDERLAQIARCCTVTVAENRDRPEGRTIDLRVIVLKPSDSGVSLPPLFDIDGGPGLPATKNAEFYATFGSAYRAGREVVMIDQRGTGRSNPLTCPGLAASELAYQPMFPAAEVAACREALVSRADLTRYGTREAVADLDAVRRALGYETIDIFALSYGTTVALRYMASHPERVRAAVLMGVAPPAAMPPSGHAAAGQRALDLLFQECGRSHDCKSRFDPAGDLQRVRRTLASLPGAPDEEVFLEKIRSMMYRPATARRIPYILAQAAAGDLKPFFAATAPSPSPLADGMYLSVICAEGIALMDYDSAAAASRATVFGDYRLRRQREACAQWPAGEAHPDHLRPYAPAAAMLLLSGEFDPVTPPEWADKLAETAPRARHVVLPASGHIFDGMSGIETCIDPMIVAFLQSADPAALDVSCVESVRPPAFVTDESALEE